MMRQWLEDGLKGRLRRRRSSYALEEGDFEIVMRIHGQHIATSLTCSHHGHLATAELFDLWIAPAVC